MRSRPKTPTICLLAVFSVAAPLAYGQVTLYVDASATDSPHDGSTWCQAYTTLQQALAVATSGDEILVANGTYTPTTGTNRVTTFQLISGVEIYGGYAGCGAADPDLRDLAAYPTILSGDLLGNDNPTPSSNCCTANGTQSCDDATCQTAVCAERASCCSDTWDEVCGAVARVLCCGPCGNRCENSYHVITGSGADGTAVLDGFTITGGLANGGNPSDRGAAIFNYFIAGGPVIRHCILRNNGATGKGAGMYNNLTTVTLESCLLTHNDAPDGAAIFNFQGAPFISNTTISENTAFVSQGGVKNATNDSPTIYNSIIWGNMDDGGRDASAQLNVGVGTVLTIDYTCVQGLTGTYGGTGNTGSDPSFVDPDGADNIPGTADDDFHLMSASPLIDTGDPDYTPPSQSTDLDLAARFSGCGVDLGAYEYPAPPDLDCSDSPVPALPQWGLIILALLILCAASVCYRPQAEASAP